MVILHQILERRDRIESDFLWGCPQPYCQKIRNEGLCSRTVWCVKKVTEAGAGLWLRLLEESYHRRIRYGIISIPADIADVSSTRQIVSRNRVI